MDKTEQNDCLIAIESRITPSGEFYPPQVVFYAKEIRSLSTDEKKAVLTTIKDAVKQFEDLFYD